MPDETSQTQTTGVSEGPPASTEETKATLDTDAATLDAKLQPIHKSLLGDYTRKTQALAEERKTFESERSSWLADAASRQAPTPPAAEPDDPTQQFRTLVDERARQIMNEELRPLRVQQADQQIAGLKTRFGDLFVKHMRGTATVLQASRNPVTGRPSVSLEDAFYATAKDDIIQWAKTQAYEELKAKGSVTHSVKPGPSGETVSTNNKPTLREAMARAKAKLGG